jgi:hypothetical protein
MHESDDLARRAPTGIGGRSRVTMRSEMGAARMRAREAGVVLTGLSLAAVLACHARASGEPHTAPTPAARVIAVTNRGLTDAQWIDSVGTAWATQPPSPAGSSTATTTSAPRARRAEVPAGRAIADTAIRSTSYAEADASDAHDARVTTADDPAPLAVLSGIGLLAFIVTVFALRGVLRPRVRGAA